MLYFSKLIAHYNEHISDKVHISSYSSSVNTGGYSVSDSRGFLYGRKLPSLVATDSFCVDLGGLFFNNIYNKIILFDIDGVFM